MCAPALLALTGTIATTNTSLANEGQPLTHIDLLQQPVTLRLHQEIRAGSLDTLLRSLSITHFDDSILGGGYVPDTFFRRGDTFHALLPSEKVASVQRSETDPSTAESQWYRLALAVHQGRINDISLNGKQLTALTLQNPAIASIGAPLNIYRPWQGRTRFNGALVLPVMALLDFSGNAADDYAQRLRLLHDTRALKKAMATAERALAATGETPEQDAKLVYKLRAWLRYAPFDLGGGNIVHGFDAGAHALFAKPLVDVNQCQAIALAVAAGTSLANTAKYSTLTLKRNALADYMAATGKLSPKNAEVCRQDPLEIKRHATLPLPLEQLIVQAVNSLGIEPETTGQTLQTTVSPHYQWVANVLIHGLMSSGIAADMAVVDRNTGHILALAALAPSGEALAEYPARSILFPVIAATLLAEDEMEASLLMDELLLGNAWAADASAATDAIMEALEDTTTLDHLDLHGHGSLPAVAVAHAFAQATSTYDIGKKSGLFPQNSTSSKTDRTHEIDSFLATARSITSESSPDHFFVQQDSGTWLVLIKNQAVFAVHLATDPATSAEPLATQVTRTITALLPTQSWEAQALSGYSMKWIDQSTGLTTSLECPNAVWLPGLPSRPLGLTDTIFQALTGGGDSLVQAVSDVPSSCVAIPAQLALPSWNLRTLAGIFVSGSNQ